MFHETSDSRFCIQQSAVNYNWQTLNNSSDSSAAAFTKRPEISALIIEEFSTGFSAESHTNCANKRQGDHRLPMLSAQTRNVKHLPSRSLPSTPCEAKGGGAEILHLTLMKHSVEFSESRIPGETETELNSS